MIGRRSSIAAFVATTIAGALSARAGNLPIPCVAGSCGTAVTSFVSSGAATAVASGNTMRIDQQTDKAILNWASFDVGADSKVQFNQPAVSSIALNKIYSANPSQIFGAIEANGQVYLVNPNGMVFGATSRVRTAGLIASTLDITADNFNAGLLTPIQKRQAALSADPIYEKDADGNVKVDKDGKPIEVQIRLVVEQGAEITTQGTGQRVVLAGQNVENSGKISTPQGQAIIAAGHKVYLQASGDPNLRGLLVEVDQGGTAWNRLTGNISATQGNVTIAGLAVNQDGRVSATTTVNANGSIRLQARDTATFTGIDTIVPVATKGGTLKVGSNSSTSVLPDLADTATAVDDQTQLLSSVDLSGQKIFVDSGASIVAPGGNVSITAKSNFGTSPTTSYTAYDPAAEVRIHSGALIDVSGTQASAPVTRNLVTVELRSNELADSPLQRDSAIRGKPLIVDARVGTPLGDVSAALKTVARGVGERTAKGGTVAIASDGDVMVNSGAIVDVSGGQIDYTPGVIQTTQLMGADGRLYDVGSAPNDIVYTGLINPTSKVSYDRWGVTRTVSGPSIGHYDPGYTEGKDGGVLSIMAPALSLNGDFRGSIVTGQLQRDPARMPTGALFQIGDPTGSGTNVAFPDYRAPSVSFVDSPTPLAVSDGATMPAGTLELPIDFLTRGGFGRTAIYSNGNVEVALPDPLKLMPGSSFLLVGNRVDVRSDIIAPAGALTFSAVQTNGLPSGQQPSTRGVSIADGVTVDVRGTWTNDLLDVRNGVPARQLASPVFKDGGSISLTTSWESGGDGVSLGDNVNLLASGGAWVTSTGALKGGKGGAITIQSGLPDSILSIGSNTHLEAFGVNGAAGGSFTLEAPRIEITNGTEWAETSEKPKPWSTMALTVAALSDNEPPTPSTVLGSALFSDFGFAKFTLNGSGLVTDDRPAAVSILSGTTLTPRVRTVLLDPNALRNEATGASLADFSSVYTPLDGLRSPVSMTFGVTEPRRVTTLPAGKRVGIVELADGATIQADPGSSIRFASEGGGVRLAGSVSAPGGTITAFIDNPSPSEIFDSGFDPAIGIDVLSSARLDVSGTYLLQPNDTGLLTGSVLDGGTIELLANRGSVAVRSGARLLADGGSGLLDLPNLAKPSAGYTRTLVGGAGGTISVRAPESILLAADMSAHAGATSGAAVAGGTLSVQLTRFAGFSARAPDAFPQTDRVLQLTDGQKLVGTRAPNGLGAVDARSVAAGGFDSLVLEAGDRLEIDPGVDLHLARQIRIDTADVSVSNDGDARLSAAYVALGSRFSTPSTSSAGFGTLAISGDLIDITGNTSVSGVSSVLFSSTGDIRLTGWAQGGVSTGSLVSAGDITLRSARLYPTTETSFTIQSAGGTSDVVRIEQAGTSSGVPLSAAGTVNILARDIVQAGTLLAPFGQISLQAEDSVTFAANSVTSVSAGDTMVPFGTIVLGDWRYTLGGQFLSQTAIPDRQVTVDASEVDMQAGSTIDLRGGGDLYAYEWVPGTGGTHDALAVGQNPNLFVVFPSMRGQSGAYDPMEYQGSTISAGDTVYLSGSDLLPAGTYALYPARYALLPGAVLVEARPEFSTMALNATSRLADGAQVVAGRRTFLNTGIGDSVYSGFAIRDGSYGRELASYNDYYASTFFPARADRLDLARAAIPADAAALSINVGQKLIAAGTVQSAGAKGGLGAAVDISATKLEIVGSAAGLDSEAVQVRAADIEKWNAGRLLFGARRSGDGSSMELIADTIQVDGGVSLVNDEVVLAAREGIHLDGSARVASRATTSSRENDPDFATNIAKISLTGDDAGGAAVLAVSDVSRMQVMRADSATPPATLGGIFLAPEATVSSRSSLLVDAPGSGLLEGMLDGAGASWDVVSSKISFTDTPAESGLTITPKVAQTLGQAYNARLASDSSIDFYGSVGFGAGVQPDATLTDLTLVASAIQAIGGDSSVALGATRNITFEGNAAQTAPTLDSGSGAFSARASEITLGPGNLSVLGFKGVSLEASSAVQSAGTGQLQVAGTLDVTTPVLTSETGANLSVLATGALSMRPYAGGAAALEAPGLGSALSIEAPSIELGTKILQPSGIVTLKATDGAGALTLDPGALIDAGGTLVSISGRQVMSPAGTINLISNGTLTADAGSTLNVAAGTATGGSLFMQSGGLAKIGATLQGGTGAAFELFADSLDDFAGLNRALEANGFSGQRSFRVSSGDLVLGAGASITARAVNLTADGGQVNVLGTINAASDNERSTISLFGTQGVSLGAGGVLRAEGVGSDSRGGIITLGTSAGVIDLARGGLISTRGGASSGRLDLRAALTAPQNGIGDVSATLQDVSSRTIELYRSYDTTPDLLDQGTLNGYVAQLATDFNAARPALVPRTHFDVVAGLELTRDGDLTLSSLDLRTDRIAGQPVNLTVRTTGSITVDNGAKISDGFNGNNLMMGRAASLRFAAGSDFRSADPLALARGSTADFNLLANSTVRTTTGDIGIAAARDIRYEDVDTLNDPFSFDPSVYVAGAPPATAPATATFAFPTGGGQLSMTAGRDILGAQVTQSVGDWQGRQARAATPTLSEIPAAWGINIAKFGWNAGSLGGGDVSMRAGHDVLNMSVAAADSGAMQPSGILQQFDGGVLSIDAGNDISSLYAHVTHGTNLLHAGGALGKVRTFDIGDGNGPQPIGSVFSMENAAIDIVARTGIAIETAFNSTVLQQPSVAQRSRSYFYTYGENSRIDASSAAGDISFSPVEGSAGNAQAYLGEVATGDSSTIVLPPTLALHALGGDVKLSGTGYMFASDDGQLDILAARDIVGNGGLTMFDRAADTVPTVSAPAFITFDPGTNGGANGSDRHKNDAVAVEITAGRDILGQAFRLAKEAHVLAGRDIVDTSIFGQNVRSTDVTSVWAGRDIRFTSTSAETGFQVGGPGSLVVLAGRNVDLGFSGGITTVGATLNSSLPDTGADISVIAGYGPGLRVDRLVSQIVDKSDEYQKALVDFISAFSPDAPAPSYETARAQFLLMDPSAQMGLVSKVFFGELVKSGREVNADPRLGYDRGYAAIDALFPGSRPGGNDPVSPYQGDILLTFSRIYSVSDGTISLFAPGGLLNVGIANPPADIPPRNPSALGIVAQRAGDVRVFTAGDVLVNSSKIFTLGGGDIAIWSTFGDIDAGRGSKSAISAPPPTITVDDQGNVHVDLGAAAQGNGIRTIKVREDITPGNVDLIAPAGIVNAGDAGIGAAGNLNIAAQQVVGLDNIQVGGSSTGVPAETSNLGAALSGASSASTSATSSSSAAAEQRSDTGPAPLAETALGWLDVFVEGFGEDVCKAADEQCMQRSRKVPL